MLTVRPALPEELDRLMEIYRSAQEFMIRSGNPYQWGRFNPTRAMIRADIQAFRCRAVTQDGAVVGVFALCTGADPTYQMIEHGQWGGEGPYVTVHRIASDGSAPGVFRTAVEYCRRLLPVVRVDTHRDNRVMQRKLDENGFVRCGVIRLANGSPRIAYEWRAEGA